MRITKQTFYNIYLPILLFTATFCSKLFFIADRDICLDEPFTIFHAQFGVWDILALPAQNEPNPPLFMLLLHFWIKLFGITAQSVRILPLLFNALTVVFIYLTGKRIINIAAGILASGLFMFSTLHFYFGLETRAYSLLSLATAASLYYFLSIIRNYENKKLLIALVLANLLLVYSHYFGWFIVFIQFIISFTYLKNKELYRILIISTIFTVIGFLPMMPVFIKQFFISGKGTWVHPPSKFEYLNQLSVFLNSRLVFISFVVIFIAGTVYLLWFKSYKTITRELMIVFLWWFCPFTFMFMVSAKIPMFIDRYILFNTIGFYLFIAIAINIIYKEMAAYIISGLLLILMAIQLHISPKNFYYREVKNVVHKVRDKANNKSIILIYPYWADLGFVYYYNRDIFKDFRNYDSLLLENKIIHVWNIQGAKENIDKYKNSRILYIQDGQPGDKAIYNFLDSTHTRTDTSFYPQFFNVGVFEPK